ncbi:MAG: nucleotide exchange factor GrpE [Alphaproteobacteria bacterium]|nr:nucleotide exchange factor GrpE [Alphaproteobacteria bacterium]
MNEPENIENSEEAKAGTAENPATEAAEPIDLAAAKAAAGAGAEDVPEAAEPADEPDELELAYGEVADLKDKLLRAMAETENIKRRGERERADLRKYAIADFARDMLAVSDNLQRALSAVSEEARKDNPEVAKLLEGVELTQRELRGHFDKHGIKEVDPLGEKLDPNLHQAVVQIDHPEAAQGTIVQVMQIGYKIQDRLLRAAMVGVAKGVPAEQPADAAAEEPAAADEAAQDGPAVDNGQGVDTQA